MAGNETIDIHDAAREGNINEVTRYLNGGGNINKLDDEYGGSPLQFACAGGHLEIAELLLNRGARMDIKDNNGWTCLHDACLSGHKSVISLLLERGCDYNSKNKFGKTPLETLQTSTGIKDERQRAECIAVMETFINSHPPPVPQPTIPQNNNKDLENQIETVSKQEEEKKRMEKRVEDLEEANRSLGNNLKEKEIELQTKVEELLKERRKSEELEDKLFDQKFLSDKYAQVVEAHGRQEEELKEKLTEMKKKDQEISSLQSQLSSTVVSLRRSEERIRELEAELISKSSREEGNYLRNLQELKSMVVERFKHQQEMEINETKRQRYLELTEKIKITRDKRALVSLNSELKSLNYDPNNVTENKPVDMIPLERIESQAKELYEELQSRESQHVIEGDIVSSMLCEVDRLNLLNLMKVFEVEVNLDLGEGEDGEKSTEDLKEPANNNEKDQTISHLQEQLTILKYALMMKEGELKEKQSIITRFESKLGIGLKEPHVRVESFNNNSSKNTTPKTNNDENDDREDIGRDLVDGIYRRRGQDIPCKLKMATNPIQHIQLERERLILETIRDNDSNGQQSQFIVTWLYPGQFLTDESDNLYFFTKEGELSPPSSLFSSPMKSLVFESGGLNLNQFMMENRVSVPVIQRVQILRDVARATDFLHELGIVHFDLKPENVVSFSSLSGSSVRWKLIDFDTSYDVSSSNGSSSQSPIMIRYPSNDAAALRVTEEYTSPEIMRILNYNHNNHNNQDIPVPVPVAVENTMVSSVTQSQIQRSIKSFGEKVRSFLEGSLQVEEGKRMKASELLQKSLFSTDNSTVQSTLLQLSSDTLNQQLADVHSTLSAGMERIMKG